MKALFTCAAMASLCVSFSANAQSIVLLKDLNTTVNRPIPPWFNSGEISPPIAGRVLFSGGSSTRGFELWVTDGTEAGTMLVKDLNVGPASSNPSNFVAANGTWFFFADNGTNVRQLWRSDGSALGTFMVQAVLTNHAPPPSELVAVGSAVYFAAQTPNASRELWRSDGVYVTRETLAPVGNDSETRYLTPFNGRLYFSGRNPGEGVELRRTNADGGRGGVETVVDAVASGSGDPDDFFATSNRLYYSTTWGGAGREPSVCETNGSCRMLKNIRSTNTSSIVAGQAHFGEFNGAVYFSAEDLGTVGQELFRTDGTDAGTYRLENLAAAALDSFPRDFTAVGDSLFFTAYDSTRGRELWKTDGTVGGAQVVRDIDPGFTLNAGPSKLRELGGKLYFMQSTPALGTEIWVSDGTSPGTTVLKDVNVGAGNGVNLGFGVVGAKLLFPGIDTIGFNHELWSSGGATASTAQLMTQGPTASNPAGLVRLGANALFTAADPVNGRELWTSDGTQVGTVRVADTYALGFSGAFAAAGAGVGVELSGFVYYGGRDSTNACQLWRSNGTLSGTTLVKNITPCGPNALPPRDFVVAGGKLFFVATSGDVELWVSDGTAGGTFSLDLNAGAGDSNPLHLTPLGNGVILTATVTGGESAPVFSDGTLIGTARLTVPANYPALAPGPYTVVGATAYFGALTSLLTGRELWISDGTLAGTRLQKEVGAGSINGLVNVLGHINGKVILSANGDGNGIDLWGYDPVGDSASLLRNINPALFASSAPSALTVFKGQAYFTATSPAGNELWVTDGTSMGTGQVLDICPGAQSSSPYALFAGTKVLVFRANDCVHGDEVWVTDGSKESTQLTSDVNPGAAGSTPSIASPFVEVAGRILFPAMNDRDDVEIYALDIDSTPPVVTPNISGLIRNGVYASNVRVSFTVSDAESAVWGFSGCESVTVTQDGTTVLSCTAKSLGGTTTVPVTITRDATRPSIDCPASVSVEAVDPQGAKLTQNPATATDLQDPAPLVSLEPDLNTVFTLGASLITATASDSAGNSSSCPILVQVLDTTPPSLECPDDGEVSTTNPSGVAVGFTAFASDSVDASPSITFSPPNGSIFAVGETTVVGRATDDSGNKSECTFKVTVVKGDAKSKTPKTTAPKGCGCTGSGDGLVLLGALVAGTVLRRRRIRITSTRSRWVAAFALVVVSLGLTSACQMNPAVVNATVRCGANGECPKGYACQYAANACVREGQVDETFARLDGPSLRIVPGAGNSLTNPAALNQDSTAIVHFSVTKVLARPPVLTTQPRLACALSPQGESTFDFSCQLPRNADLPPDGPVLMSADVIDTDGNAATLDLSFLNLHIDTSPPPSPDTQTRGRIVYKRAPWGTNATQGVPRFTVVGLAGAVKEASVVRVLGSNGQLGRGPVAPNGSFTEVVLLQSDTASVDVASVDSAGNESAAVTVHDVEWVAALGSTSTNPNTFEMYGAAGSTVRRGDGILATASDGLDLRDGKALRIDGAASWQRRTWVTPTTSNPSFGYDSDRGRVVRFGGGDSNVILSGYSVSLLWEWNGTDWFEVVPDPVKSTGLPRARQLGAMAYDEKLRRTMLFGGWDQGLRLGDTWFWNGESWRAVTGKPPARSRAALFYDVANERFVLFGGESATGDALSDTWLFEQDKWVQFDAGQTPPARVGASVAYDRFAGEGILFGGGLPDGGFLSDTWRFSKNGWEPFALDGGALPPSRVGAGLTYDVELNKFFLAGGRGATGALKDFWELSGGLWKPRGTTPFDAGVATPLFVYESTQQAHLLMDNRTADVWRWNDLAWTRVGGRAGGTTPSGRVAVTFDEATQGVHMLAPSSTRQVFRLSELGWASASPVGVPTAGVPNSAESFTYVPAYGGMVYVRTNATYLFDPYAPQVWTPLGAGSSPGTFSPIVQNLTGCNSIDMPLDGPAMAPTATGVMVLQGKGVDRYLLTVANSLNLCLVTALETYGGLLTGGGLAALNLSLAKPGPSTTKKFDGTDWTAGPDLDENLILPTGAGLPDGGALFSGVVLAIDGGVTHTSTYFVSDVGASRITDLEAGAVSLVYNTTRNKVIGFGGITASLASSAQLVEFDEAQVVWNAIPVSDPEGDGTISARNSAGIAHDKKNAVDVVYGGLTTTTSSLLALLTQAGLGDTWVLNYARNRPAGLMRVQLSAAQMKPGSTATSVTLSVAASGQGERNNAARLGYETTVWRAGRWSSPSAVSQSAADQFTSTTVALSEPNEVQQLLGGQSELAFQIRPLGTNGRGQARLDVDYVEVKVEYRLP